MNRTVIALFTKACYCAEYEPENVPKVVVEKFVELIVQDLVVKCQTDWYGDSLDDICTQMKSHFGVK